MGCTEIRDRIPEDRVELGSKLGFPGSSVGEESAYNAGASVDTGSIPVLERYRGEGNGNNCSMPGFPVLHHLPQFAQTYVH